MRFNFESDELRELYTTGDCPKLRLHPDVINAFFRIMQRIFDSPDERYLRGQKGLRMEKLRGSRVGQYSLRLNAQYRLIFTITQDTEGRLLLIIDIVDYH
ncbi:MAG TPA: type II toxin-antitoxin system RelE/ParE family toxin [Armatimonadota bacterium]|jgi:proteic killer suppression protein